MFGGNEITALRRLFAFPTRQSKLPTGPGSDDIKTYVSKA